MQEKSFYSAPPVDSTYKCTFVPQSQTQECSADVRAAPRILIIGDQMIDRYHVGRCERVSAEAPIPIVDVNDTFDLPGGAANVEANLRALGAHTLLLSGKPYPGKTFPVKNRLMVDDYQYARWDENDSLEAIPSDDLQFVLDKWRPAAVVVSDYGKGSIAWAAAHVLAETALPYFVDTKDPRWEWLNCTAIFPNREERTQHRCYYDSIYRVVEKLGPEGAQLHEGHKSVKICPPHSTLARSVIGAGDTFIAAFAYRYVTQGCEKDILDCCCFAVAAASVAVSKPYTATVTFQEASKALKRMYYE